MQKYINEIIDTKIGLLMKLRNSGYMEQLEQAVYELVKSLKAGKKILLAGNGGSAADAQHFAAEIVGRFMMERKSLPAISLCVDPSVVSCIGNDYGFDSVFSRQIEGLADQGDVFIAISTSGDSGNLIKAIKSAKEKGAAVIGFLGKHGGRMQKMCDYALVVPSCSTPRIQEIHTFTVHIMCEYIEKLVFADDTER